MKTKEQSRKSSVENTHPRIKVKRKMIQLLVDDILTSERAESGVDVILVNDDFMRKLNKKFTKREGTTDVLSFGMREGEREAVEYPSLGDVYVSLDQAKRQADEYGVGFDQEVRRLVAHGILHLLGHDHADEDAENIMREKEEKYSRKMRRLKTKA
jgi:probable rRNA maturation factor